MNFVFLLFLLGCWILWAHRRLKISLSIAPAFCCSSLISLLYLFHFGDYLQELTIFLWFLGPVLLGAELFRSPITFVQVRGLLKTPAPWIGVASACLCYVYLKDLGYSHWDEFSHWGVVTKVLCFEHTLNQPENSVIFRDYPPGSSLWQYFVCQILGYTEGHTYFAQTLYMAFNALPLFEKHRFKRPIGIFLLVCLVFFNMPLLGFYYNSLYVDSSLGALQIGVLSGYFFSTELKVTRKLYPVLPMLFVLPTFKEAGAFLALISALIITVDAIITRRQERDRMSAKLILLLLALFAMPLVAKTFWSYHVAHQHFRPTFNKQPISLSSSFDKILFGDATTEEQAVRTKFIQAFKTLPVGPSQLSTIQWLFVLFVELLVICLVLSSGAAFRVVVVCLVFLAGLFVYEYGLLSLYLFSFKLREALDLASFSRYQSIYFLAWQCLFFGFIVQYLVTNNKLYYNKFYCIPTLVLFVIILYKIDNNYGLNIIKNGKTVGTDVEEKLIRITEIVSLDSKVYLYFGKSNGSGLKFYFSRFYLAPIITNQYCHGSGGEMSQVQKVPCPSDEGKWQVALSNYDYIFVDDKDNIFWSEMSSDIAPKKIRKYSGLYKVIHLKTKFRLSLIDSF